MSHRIPITAKGHKRLTEELKNLKTYERPKVIEEIQRAREFGDLSENAEYSAAREKQGMIEGRIAFLEDVVSRAEIIDISKLSGEIVKFGATIKLFDEETEAENIYTIVGEHESDIKFNLISLASPIAKALIGKKIGDIVEVKTPKGFKSYEILEVGYNC